jgi:hypothetical protein
VLEVILTKVTEDMNVELSELYTDSEIKSALFQMGPTKAPRPDGLPTLFYQTHWEFLKEDICSRSKFSYYVMKFQKVSATRLWSLSLR